METKICTHCRIEKPIDQFYIPNKLYKGRKTIKSMSWCKSCTKEKSAINNNNPEYTKNATLISRYGISLKEYNSILSKQNGKCAICGGNGKKKLAVDHDHNNGRVRGLLCVRCNTAIGALNDDIGFLQRAIEYIIK